MPSAYSFDRFEIQPVTRRLLVDGQPAPIGARAFDLLRTLVENPGRLLTKSELLDRVWPGLVVEEANLHVQISSLRKLLGPQVIATIPGQGYRLAAAPAQVASQTVAVAGERAVQAASDEAGSDRARRHNLFESSEALIGREADIDALDHLLDQHRLVTAVGSSGIGKTRLAQEVARRRVDRYADGVWWVDLAALHNAEQVAPAVAKAAGLALGGGEVDQMLGLALSRRDTLLVLDNCEHLLDPVAALAVKLLESAPSLRLLATSIVPLKVHGEQVCRLDGLAVPPSPMSLELARCFAAIQLLEQRAQAVDHRFRLTDDTIGSAIELCRQLDGVALAIEMAAARLPMLGPAQVVARLDDRLRLLRSQRRTAPERHQTLGATLEWSHSLLGRDEQDALRRLAVFAGSFRLDAALAVAVGDDLDQPAALDALCGLVEKSLLHVVGLEPPRYRLLETTRVFAAERLTGSIDALPTRERFCQAMAAVAVEAESALDTMADRPWLQRYLPDYENIRSAFAQACRDGALEWGADLATSWAVLDWMRGDMQNRKVRLPAAATLLPAAKGLARIKLLKLFTTTFSSTSADAGISRIDAVRELVALCREHGDPRRLYDALGRQAAIAAMLNDRPTTALALAEARSLERADWPDRLKEMMSQWVAGICSHFDDQAGWEREVGFILEIAQKNGFDNSLAYVPMELAALAIHRGDPVRAVALCQQSLDGLHRLGITTIWGLASAVMCAAQVLAGELQGAAASARAAQPVQRAVDMEGWLCLPVALLCARTARPVEASQLLGCNQSWRTAHKSAAEAWEVRLTGIFSTELRNSLGSAEFDRLHAIGAAMTDDEAHRLLCAALALPTTV